MSEALAHVYDLALRALAEQERQVAELRGRLTPILASGGLGATLLTPLAFRGGHPAGILEVAFVAVGLLGIAVEVAAALYVLAPRRLRFGLTAAAAASFAERRGIAESTAFYGAVTTGLDDRRAANEQVIRWLHFAFTLMMCGMLLEVCGLAIAAAIA
ncbi:MAG TPA: hypothetical protein VE972_06285 [Conexibacter sp.]|nr:hypothetical protein [Conexibacter sp.]